MHRVQITGDAIPDAIDALRGVHQGVLCHVAMEPAHSVMGRSAGPSAVMGADGMRASVPTSGLEEVSAQFASWCDLLVVSGQADLPLPTIAVGDTAPPAEGVAVARPADITAETIDELLAGVDPYMTLSGLIDRVKAHPAAPQAGAIATFTGRVRRYDGEDDSATLRLTFERYDPVASDRLRKIETELEARDGVYAVELFHRTGIIQDGEDIVFVVVLAGHRTEAFRAVEDGINRLKDEVPIFKHETTTTSDFWVHDPPGPTGE